jgi:primosomal protein N'
MRLPSLDFTLPAANASRKRVPVLLPYPFAGPFDYAVPEGMNVQPGDMVLVPLNRRAEVGVVWDASQGDAVPAAKLKPIDAVLDAPAMQPALRQFIDWVAGYTLAPPGDVLAMALRVNALAPPTPQAGWTRRAPHRLGRGAGCRCVPGDHPWHGGGGAAATHDPARRAAVHDARPAVSRPHAVARAGRSCRVAPPSRGGRRVQRVGTGRGHRVGQDGGVS